MALGVIKSHCFNRNSTKNKIILILTKSRRIHVPSFVILSFYFTHNTLISPDVDKKYTRFERLLIPYIGWPTIFYVMNKLLYYFVKQNYHCTLKNLIYQIVIAQSLNMPFHFWFLFDLIITNILFIFIIIILRKDYLLILQLLMFFAYFLQYSEINMKLYIICNENNSLGREVEILPFSVIGFFLYELNIINKIQNYKFNTIIISLLLYNFIGYYMVFSDFKGISYHGIKLAVRSLCIIFFFSLFSFENIKNKYFLYFLKVITKNTGGIFYLHQVIHHYFKNIFIIIRKGTLSSLFLIYFISYIIYFLGTIIFGKTKFKYLFS